MKHKIISIARIGTKEIHVVFQDGAGWVVNPIDLGMNGKLFDLRTIKCAEGGISVQAKKCKTDVLFDADNIRYQVDPAYAEEVQKHLNWLTHEVGCLLGRKTSR